MCHAAARSVGGEVGETVPTRGGREQTQTIEPRRGTGGSLPKGGAPWAMDVVVRLRVVVRCLWGLIDRWQVKKALLQRL